MSDPLSSHEIEDVLSSIRRLVSEDLRPGAPRSRIPVAGDPQRAEARLILTPALRVIQKAAAEAASRPVGQAAEEGDWEFEALVPEPQDLAPPPPVTEDLRNDRLRAAATKAFPRASGGVLDVFHSRRADTGPGDEEDELFAGAPVAPATRALGLEVAAPEVMIWDDDAMDEAALQARRHDLLMDAEDAVDLVSPAPTPEEMPLTGSIIDPEPMAPMWSNVNDTLGAWREEGPATWEEAPSSEPVRVLRENPAVRAWAGRLEETLRAELGVEMQEPLEAVVVGTFRPEAAAEAAAAPAPAPEPSVPEIEAEVARELGQIDEDLLRELVREVLREELAGALGERITRNVRKLVRMEINRALSAGEFQ